MNWVTPLRSGFDTGRRLLVAAGTSHFSNLPDQNLLQASYEVEKIANAFRALGYDQLLGSTVENRDQLRVLFENARKSCTKGDLLVVYYTAHGATDAIENRFYLLTQESNIDDLSGTALAAEDLARVLCTNSEAAQVLVILDACYAGAGAAQLAQLVARLAISSSPCPEFFVIAAARPKQEAEQGALSQALALVVENPHGQLGGSTQKFLGAFDVMEGIRQYLDKNHPAQQASFTCFGVQGLCYLFPNPRYRPGIPSGLDLATQRSFRTHWLPKAQGAGVGTSAWYFTGREQALKELVGWLRHSSSDGKTRVVTGGPGCGKSALLARIVTLSNEAYRKEILAAGESELLADTIPPTGVVSAAVHVRHMLLNDVVKAIADALGCMANDATELLDAIRRRDDKTVIVVDALDEADEVAKIVSELVRPLTGLNHIFLLVGTRPDSPQLDRRVRSLGEATVEINLDDAGYIGSDDVARYVEQRLMATEEPERETVYRSVPEVARQVALAVSARAKGVFLVAHTAVLALLMNPSPVDVDVVGWDENLPTGLEDAFALFLEKIDWHNPDDLSSQIVRAVLLPLAFAEGEGLPWVDLWAPLATDISRSTVTDSDITLVREHAAAFIVEAVENNGSVYRLYHEKLAEYLRELSDTKDVQQRIVNVLRSRALIAGTERHLAWTRAHPYMGTHLVSHALKGGVIDSLIDDGNFTSAADPLRMLQALSKSNEPLARRANRCYQLAFRNLIDRSVEDRLSYLEMAARQIGDDELADIWTRGTSSRNWAVPWIRSSGVSSHREISSPWANGASSLAILAGRPVIVTSEAAGVIGVRDLQSGMLVREPLVVHAKIATIATRIVDHESLAVLGGYDGSLRVWNPTLGSLVCELIQGHTGSVNSISFGTLQGHEVFVSGGSDGTVRVWNLMTGAAVGQPLSGHHDRVDSVGLGVLNERQVIVSGDDAGTIRVWDLVSGVPVGSPLRCHEFGVDALAIGEIDGRPVIVSAGGACELRIWDLESRTPIGEPLYGHEDWVNALALFKLEGRTVIVSGSDDHMVRLWDLNSGASIGQPLRGHDGAVDWVGIAELDHGTFVVSRGDDGTVRVWDIPMATPNSVGWETRTSKMESVALATMDGRSLIVSGGSDGTVRVWDAVSGAPVIQMEAHDYGVALVAVSKIADRRVITSGEHGAIVKVWDFVSGDLIDTILPQHRSRLTLIGLLDVGNRPAIVWQTTDFTMLVYDVASKQRICGPLVGHTGWVRSIAATTVEERLMLVTGGDDRTVRVWSLTFGTQIGSPLRGHKRGVGAVALGVLKGRSIIVSGGKDGTLRIWDLGSLTKIDDLPSSPNESVNALALYTVQDRLFIFAGGEGRVVRLWDAARKESTVVNIASRIMSIVSTGDGHMVVATSSGLTALQFAVQ